MKRTPLYEQHKKLNAKMVEFGGWEMPVSYSGVLKEHQAVREKVGLFDVSHMGEVLVEGPDALKFLQWLTSNDLNLIGEGQCQYSLLMRPNGGVVDDIIIHKMGPQKFFICVNASNTDKDFAWIKEHQKDFDVSVQNQSAEYSQLALQGPLAEKLLQKFVSVDLSKIKSFHFVETSPPAPLLGKERGAEISPSLQRRGLGGGMLIARTGYTGEPGFEIYCSNTDAPKIWGTLIDAGKEFGLLPCGLGCRDTLRLEMAYPLYGHELNDEITPLEAGLAWVVKMNKGDFIGREVLLKQKEEGLKQKRVGFILKDPGIAREGYLIFAGDEKVGNVVSGTYSPSLDKSIGCGYVPPSLSTFGTKIFIEIRGKKKLAEVVPTPFYNRGVQQ